MRLEALGWLRGQFARRAFKIGIVGGGGNPLAELERIVGDISSGDSVIVHVSARLVGSDSIALNRTTVIRLSTLTDLFARQEPGYASFVLDLVGDAEGEPRAPDADNLLADVARALGTADHGYSLLLALRPPDEAIDRIEFTRRALSPLDDDGPPSGAALLSAMHERAVATRQQGGNAQSVLLAPGAPDPTIDGLVAEATQARDWPRIVELRLGRIETLATPAQRAQELAGVARIRQFELDDADAAVDLLEQARALDPTRTAVLDALRSAYEASGRAPPIDPAEHARAFAAHRRAGQMDGALLNAMLLEEVGAAEPLHRTLVEQSRSAGPVQVLRPLDEAGWDALRASGFDPDLAARLAQQAADRARASIKASRRRLEGATRLDATSTVSAVRTMHWAARVLGLECPDLYAGTEDTGPEVTHVAGERPSILLAPGVLSGMSSKQLAFLAGRELTWYRPEYRCLLSGPTLDDLRELVGAVEGRVLERWAQSAELTAARAGLFLCGELKIAVAGARSPSPALARLSSERVAADLVAFCASPSHAALRAQFLRSATQSGVPPQGG